MAQKVTVKEVYPATADKKPTVLVMTDGARMSGFQAGLKNVKPGAVLKIEVEVQGRYINIMEFEEISPGVESPGGENHQADPAKAASLEAQKACELVMSSYTRLLIAGADVPPRLKELWERSLGWCGAKIPVLGKPWLTADQEFDKLRRAEDKPPPGAPQKTAPTVANLQKVMKDNGWEAGDLGKYFVNVAEIKVSRLTDLKPDQIAAAVKYIEENPK